VEHWECYLVLLTAAGKRRIIPANIGNEQLFLPMKSSTQVAFDITRLQPVGKNEVIAFPQGPFCVFFQLGDSLSVNAAWIKSNLALLQFSQQTLTHLVIKPNLISTRVKIFNRTTTCWSSCSVQFILIFPEPTRQLAHHSTFQISHTPPLLITPPLPFLLQILPQPSLQSPLQPLLLFFSLLFIFLSPFIVSIKPF
jgi:hypothetical protein